MAFTFNGIGTKYYGSRALPDGTYVRTKWIVFAYVPIIPLGSVHVLNASAPRGFFVYGSQSLSVQKVPLDGGMVLKTYGLVIGAVIGIIVIVKALVWMGWL
jgi:hypothetical protein